jgi:hypothetical protein
MINILTKISATRNATRPQLRYPGVKFVRADGRNLPFDDNAFDFVHSSAVVEHGGNAKTTGSVSLRVMAGGPERNICYDAQLLVSGRVSPVLPLIQWLPARQYRKLLTALGYGFFCRRGQPQFDVRPQPCASGQGGGHPTIRDWIGFAPRLADQSSANRCQSDLSFNQNLWCRIFGLGAISRAGSHTRGSHHKGHSQVLGGNFGRTSREKCFGRVYCYSGASPQHL